MVAVTSSRGRVRGDILVLGGGPAGATAAWSAAARGARVWVVDARTAPKRAVGEDLPARSKVLLDRLGLTEHMHGDRDLWCESPGLCWLWDGEKPGERPAIADRFGSGVRLHRGHFDQLLARRSQQRGARWLRGWKLDELRRASDTWHVGLKGPNFRRMTTAFRFVIDATGRSSHLARRLACQRRKFDRLAALCVRYTSLDTAGDATILIQSAPEGWCYLARSPDGDLSLMLFGDADLLRPLKLNRADRVDAYVRKNLPWLAQRLRAAHVQPERMVVRDASTAMLEQPYGEAWLAVGDAAASFDPIASQGLSQALATGLYGGHAAVDSLAGRGDALDAYAHVVRLGVEAFHSEHAQLYRAVRKWPEAAFWHRRQRAS